MMMINGSSHSTTVWKQISIKQNELADVSQALAERGLYAITLSSICFFVCRVKMLILVGHWLEWPSWRPWAATALAAEAYRVGHSGRNDLLIDARLGYTCPTHCYTYYQLKHNPNVAYTSCQCPLTVKHSFWMCPFFLIFVIHISQYYWRKIYLIMSMSIFAKSLLLLKSHFYHQLWSDCILR